MAEQRKNSLHAGQLAPADIIESIRQWQRGEAGADGTEAEWVYRQLLRRARAILRNERRIIAFSAHDLVSEIWLRLSARTKPWRDRNHFFAVSSRAMRRVLVDHARAANRDKRGGGWEMVVFDGGGLAGAERPVSILRLDDALRALAQLAPRQSKVVELRFFGGLSAEETACALSLAKATVDRDWSAARAWLVRELRGGTASDEAIPGMPANGPPFAFSPRLSSPSCPPFIGQFGFLPGDFHS